MTKAMMTPPENVNMVNYRKINTRLSSYQHIPVVSGCVSYAHICQLPAVMTLSPDYLIRVMMWMKWVSGVQSRLSRGPTWQVYQWSVLSWTLQVACRTRHPVTWPCPPTWHSLICLHRHISNITDSLSLSLSINLHWNFNIAVTLGKSDLRWPYYRDNFLTLFIMGNYLGLS